ncbi:ParB/RepB/Spo0J family partition protein [Variovorax paradoxus]|uniref:ParB/RepB/Spo0J family partition protein n=1 Tax=Variovorax paradoxus TaxID=34073 RepID=UPI0019342D2B|nr:ParB/RepB/Spo0J family partition protein [Variovorax paradoxus]
MNATAEIELSPGNVKAAMRAAGAKSSDLWMVPVANIRVIAGYNIRPVDREHVEAIKESIRINGYSKDKPLAGYVSKEEGDGDIINLTDGEHRLTAVLELVDEGEPIEFLPVTVAPAGTSMVDLAVSMATSASGKELTPQAWATLCKRLIGYGLDVDEIAKRLVKKKQQISDWLVLAGASRRVLVMVEGGKVSGTNAIRLLKKHGAGTADVLEKKFEAAQAKGKKKVTAAVLSPQRDLVADGAEWIKSNTAAGDLGPLVAFLSHLSGSPHADIAARLGIDTAAAGEPA